MSNGKYIVRQFFRGDAQGNVSTHRTLKAAVEAAGRLFRKGSEGWQAKVVVPAGEDIDYTARTADGREVNLTH